MPRGRKKAQNDDNANSTVTSHRSRVSLANFLPKFTFGKSKPQTDDQIYGGAHDESAMYVDQAAIRRMNSRDSITSIYSTTSPIRKASSVDSYYEYDESNPTPPIAPYNIDEYLNDAFSIDQFFDGSQRDSTAGTTIDDPLYAIAYDPSNNIYEEIPALKKEESEMSIDLDAAVTPKDTPPPLPPRNENMKALDIVRKELSKLDKSSEADHVQDNGPKNEDDGPAPTV